MFDFFDFFDIIIAMMMSTTFDVAFGIDEFVFPNFFVLDMGESIIWGW